MELSKGQAVSGTHLQELELDRVTVNQDKILPYKSLLEIHSQLNYKGSFQTQSNAPASQSCELPSWAPRLLLNSLRGEDLQHH